MDQRLPQNSSQNAHTFAGLNVTTNRCHFQDSANPKRNLGTRQRLISASHPAPQLLPGHTLHSHTPHPAEPCLVIGTPQNAERSKYSNANSAVWVSPRSSQLWSGACMIQSRSRSSYWCHMLALTAGELSVSIFGLHSVCFREVDSKIVNLGRQ